MEFIAISIGTTILGILGYFLMSAFVRTPGKILESKFAKLGDMTGKTYQEIRNAVGVENSVSKTTDKNGKVVTVRQWMATGYHIVLLFDENDVFIGISNEIAV